MSMSMVDAEKDRRKVERALARRKKMLGAGGPDIESPEVGDYERTLYGRPVRVELDVCVPIEDLKKMLNGVRAEISNAILALERPGSSPHDCRFAAHRHLSSARAKVFYMRQDLEQRGKSQHK